MKAARLRRTQEMAVEDVPRPVPQTGDLLVRIEAAGLCGSDRHMFRGEYPTALPVTLGHEFCGIVEATGPGVARVKPGDRVTADPNIACGYCAACREGRVNLCANLQAIGVTRDGGFAEYAIVPEKQAIVLPESLDPLEGAFSEPLACCLHGMDVAKIKSGDSVAIFGGGVIGLLMVQLARLAGAGTVILSTRQASRRALGETLGAAHSVDPAKSDPVEAIRAAAAGGVDVAFECAGVPETFAQALAATRNGGVMVLFGVMAKGQQVAIEPWDLLTREIRLESAYLNPHTQRRAAETIASGALRLAPLITRTITLEELPAELGGNPSLGDVKVMVRP
jgi:threonine dehydrogenase-like Zn-dependent dehydrogenase